MSHLEKAFDQFQYFPSLPPEIRLMIWALAINERRILQVKRCVSAADKKDYTKGWKIVSACTPSLLWTNYESRIHTLKFYRLLFPLETIVNLYINDKLDSLYLVTPYEVVYGLNDNIWDMWQPGGVMDIACLYLCEYGMVTSIVMDYNHLCYGEEEWDLSVHDYMLEEHAGHWAQTIHFLAKMVSWTFLRNGDAGLLHGKQQISKPSPIPTTFDSLLRQCRSKIYRNDGEELEVPFPSITICDVQKDTEV